ncbi:MAG: FtsK/SpoIIIE domain-containing protein, partial [Actinomycetota bacterium]|nr:FtsK/SpoIIIE domain-containing protein [Actinomycetota bacterium]
MELPLVVVSPGRPPTPVLLQADPGTTVAEAAAALVEGLDLAGGRVRPTPEATGRAAVELYQGSTRLAGTDELAGCGLAQGSVIGLGAPAPPASTGEDGVELAVVGGLGAGRRVAASPPAVITLGRSVDNTVPLDDPQASRHHARVDLRPDAAVLQDLGSTNGVGWAGYRLGGPQALSLGDAFMIGDTVLALRAAEPTATVLDPVAGAGTRHFNRPPRLPPPPVVTDLDVPTEPEKPVGRRFPLLSLLAPVVIGAVLVTVLHSLIYLAFIVLAPVMGLSNYLGDRRHGRREYRTKLAAYQRDVAELDANLAAAVAADERARRSALPDPAAITRIATAPTTRLWERRIDDEDFLRVRVGVADVAAHVNLRGKAGRPTPTARLVPVSFDAGDAGVMGLAGPRPAALALARAMIVGAAVLHSPRDLRIGVLAGQDAIDDWAWMAWLPHLIPLDPSWGSARFVGAGRQQAEERLAALRRLIDDRREVARNQLRTGPPPAARVLVVLDGARRLRALEGLTDVLRAGPDAGVVALCLDDHETSLPEECRVTVAASNKAGTRVVVRRRGAEPVNDVIADGMGTEMADEVARALAPVRDSGPATGGGAAELPRSLRLLDLVGLDEPTEADVTRVWQGPAGGRSTEAVLGAGPGGPFVVDLRRDGPHGLVAGTTGAGKSELLQSFVASLALANRPDALAFVLVDYKGGSAFKECRELPHCVGLVTDLDGHLAGRALASLTAELKRREGLLAHAGAANIEEYWATAALGTSPHLPRLAIVVDEFATLVDEVPEFVQGVIGIGMRGRSLGVHVILATQRPAGVVSAELRANVNLRLCLRVANPEESTDVIGVPDAARIARDTPGRAYALTGYRDLTLFQTARIGVPRATGSRRGQPRAVTVEPLRLTALGAGMREDPEEEASAGAPTDLSVLVSAIAAAATTRGIERPASPWLAPLPDLVPLEAPPAPAGLVSAGVLEAMIGLIDRPEAQAQEPFVLDLDRTGSVLVIGAVRSGRSTTLRTIVAGLVATRSPEDLHLYGVDCGNRALDSLAALPHCGAVVSGDDPERLIRLVDLLSELVRHRGQTGQATPPVVVVVDRLEAFVARYAERDGGRLVDRLDQLLREGGAVGVTFVISGDRTAFTTRLSSAVEARLVLRQADRSDYGLVGLDVRRIPAHMPNGRALWAQTGHEVQIGILGP